MRRQKSKSIACKCEKVKLWKTVIARLVKFVGFLENIFIIEIARKGSA
jgi:hypothetical protein